MCRGHGNEGAASGIVYQYLTFARPERLWSRDGWRRHVGILLKQARHRDNCNVKRHGYGRRPVSVGWLLW